MKLIRSIDSALLPRDGIALTIGNFDAVHLGHREILRALTAQARARKLPSAVMTFDPHPQEYFGGGDSKLARLTTTPTRFFALRECGVDWMISLRFNRALARTCAEDFVRHHLAQRLHVRYLLIGDDFRFGAARAGDFDLLQRLATECGYEVALLDTVVRGAQRVSSTRIRALLADGDLAQAERLLGRRYAHCGRVTRGDRRGREWGVPTINLAIRHRPAVTGVFAVTVDGLGARRDGVASLGTRPTIHANGAPKYVLEVHLFDYDGDAYGVRVCVEFVEKIRDEAKFDDYAALIARMREDIAAAAVILKRTR